MTRLLAALAALFTVVIFATAHGVFASSLTFKSAKLLLTKDKDAKASPPRPAATAAPAPQHNVWEVTQPGERGAPISDPDPLEPHDKNNAGISGEMGV